MSLLAAAVAALSVAAADPGAEAEGRSGVFRTEVADRPADGALTISTRDPGVVRCVLDQDGREQPLPFRRGRDGASVTVRLPEGFEGPADVLVETASGSGQQADGRWIFDPADAASKSSTESTWEYDATRWGRYSVSVTYPVALGGEARKGGRRIEVEIGGVSVSGDVPATESSGWCSAVELGTVYLAEAGRKRLVVREADAGVGDMLDVVAVILDPACEGEPLAQRGNEAIVLHGRDAIVRGTTLRYEPAEKKQTLGYWTRVSDVAEWRFNVATAGAYDVEVLQGCGPGQGGSEVAVSVADQEIEFQVDETGGFQDFKARVIGRVDLDRGGEYRLTVRPRRIAKKAALDLRQVRLVPVAP